MALQLLSPMRDLVPVAALRDNYIWIFALTGDHFVIVDPGESAPVIAHLDAQNCGRLSILLTHHHPDHIGGCGALIARWPTQIYAPVEPRIALDVTRVGDGDSVTLDDTHTAKVIAVPGHTLSHIAFLLDDLLFCGDTLFSVGCGRVFEGTSAQMTASLDRLAALPATTRICCGHEYTVANCRFARSVDPLNTALQTHAVWAQQQRASDRPTLPSSIARERAVNPFLRLDATAIRESVDDAAGGLERSDVFARLRAMKDVYA